MSTQNLIRVNILFISSLLASSLLANNLSDENTAINKPESSNTNEAALPVTPWLWENINHLQSGSENASLDHDNQQGRELTIQANGMAIFKVPRAYWLRLTNIANASHSQASNPDLWYSSGNGLFIPIQPQMGKVTTNQQQEWLLPPPISGELTFMLKNTRSTFCT